jgi:hypothetical protein
MFLPSRKVTNTSNEYKRATSSTPKSPCYCLSLPFSFFLPLPLAKWARSLQISFALASTAQRSIIRGVEWHDLVISVVLSSHIGIVSAGKVCISPSRITIYHANMITTHTHIIRMPRPIQHFPDALERRLQHPEVSHHQQRVCRHLVCVCRKWVRVEGIIVRG